MSENVIEILVAAPREIHDDRRGGRSSRRLLDRVSHGMRGLERGQDPLETREKRERIERLLIRDADVAGAARIPQVRMLRTDTGIVETRGDAVRLLHLS